MGFPSLSPSAPWPPLSLSYQTCPLPPSSPALRRPPSSLFPAPPRPARPAPSLTVVQHGPLGTVAALHAVALAVPEVVRFVGEAVEVAAPAARLVLHAAAALERCEEPRAAESASASGGRARRNPRMRTTCNLSVRGAPRHFS